MASPSQSACEGIEADPIVPLVKCQSSASNAAEVLLILNTMTVLHDSSRAYRFLMSNGMMLKPKDKANRRMIENRLIYLTCDWEDSGSQQSKDSVTEMGYKNMKLTNIMKSTENSINKNLKVPEGRTGKKTNFIVIYADEVPGPDMITMLCPLR